MEPLSIHHVAINVTDLETALAFYRGTLGLSLRDDRPAAIGPGAWLSAGDSEVHLTVGTAPTRGGQHFAIAVRDFDATWAELRHSGAEVREPRLSGDGSCRQFYVADPSRNWVEIREVGPQ